MIDASSLVPTLPSLLVNALIHVANTLLVFWFLLRTTRARWPSALVAALFALHRCTWNRWLGFLNAKIPSPHFSGCCP